MAKGKCELKAESKVPTHNQWCKALDVSPSQAIIYEKAQTSDV